jgi:hypothetical protein
MDTKETSLKEFIEANHILLSTLAVFATITAFITKLSIEWLAITLSFIFIIGMIIVWHEIHSHFPEKMSFKLWLFRYVLLFGFSCLALYSLLEFRQIWNMLLFIPLSILFMYVIISALKPLTRFNIVIKILGIRQQKNIWQKIMRVICVIGIMIISLSFASIFSPFINLLLTWIRASFK